MVYALAGFLKLYGSSFGGGGNLGSLALCCFALAVSYFDFSAGSLKISCAACTAWNFETNSTSRPGFRSGWYCFAAISQSGTVCVHSDPTQHPELLLYLVFICIRREFEVCVVILLDICFHHLGRVCLYLNLEEECNSEILCG